MFQTGDESYSEVSITELDAVKASKVACEFYKQMTLDLHGIWGCELIKSKKQIIAEDKAKYKIVFKTEVVDGGDTTSLYCSSIVNKGSGDTDFELIDVVCDSTEEEAEKDEEYEELELAVGQEADDSAEVPIYRNS